MEELSEKKIVKRIEDMSDKMAKDCQSSSTSFLGFVDCLTALEQKMKNIAYLPFYLEQTYQRCLAQGESVQSCQAAAHEKKLQALHEAYESFKAYDAPLPE